MLIDTVAILKSATESEHPEGKILQQIMAHYPEPYQTRHLNRNRGLEWVRNNKKGCIPWLIKTAAREQEFLFTLPYTAEAAMQLVVLQNSVWAHKLLKLQQLPQPVSLARLFNERPSPLLGIEVNRTYGDKVDLILQQYADSSKLYTRSSSSEEIGSLLPMLQRGFIDMMLEYPKYTERSGLALDYFQIQESAPINLVHFACSKGEHGERIVQRLNQTIRHLSRQTAYQQLIIQDIPPQQQSVVLQFWLQQIQ